MWCWASSPVRRPTFCCAWRTPPICASRSAWCIELKQVGRPILLVLNMIDIARRRGIDIDLAKLSAELGVPVVTSIAVRRGGTEELLRRMDELAAGAAAPTVDSIWKTPTTSDLRTAQREADRVIKAAVGQPSRPDTMTGRDRRGAAAPGRGPADPVVHPVRDVPGGVRLGEAADGHDRRRLRMARRAGAATRCRKACCRASSRTA